MDDILLEDPELARAIVLESDRQISKLELIASENFVSPAVMAAMANETIFFIFVGMLILIFVQS